MKVPFEFTRIGRAASKFRSQRADWYEYLADMIQDSHGKRTLRDILEADANRYSKTSARGILSAYWHHKIGESGGIGAMLAGTLPAREVAMLANLQRSGQTAFTDGLRDLARQARLEASLIATVRSTVMTGVISLAILIAVVFGVIPYYSGPEIAATFSQVPHESYGPWARLLIDGGQWLRSHDVRIWTFLLGFGAWYLWSFRNLANRLRSWMDGWGPHRLYREIQSIWVVSTLANTVKKRMGRTVDFRTALADLRTGASYWLATKIDQMLVRLEDSKSGVEILDVGLLDQETFWYLHDLAGALGMDTALQKMRHRLETAVFKRVESRAAFLRWALLLTSIAAMLGVLLLHYAVLLEMRGRLLLLPT